MEKLFNDSVHGHIFMPALCVKIIDTPIFQRLRQVKQLGFGYCVYPGASHNRFEHCLGVSHLAGIVADKLNINLDEKYKITKEEKLCLQVAGLCHDLGHGPFSHTWEKFLQREGKKWKHEEMSIKLFKLILENEAVKNEFRNQNLQDHHKEIIQNIILGSKPDNETRAFLYEIISNRNGIDVDKWDYLLRDSKYLNIGITFDPHRLMNCQRVLKTTDGNYQICYRDKAREEIWQMYMMRAELHRKAYQHQVVKILEEMWYDALRCFSRSGYRFLGIPLSEIHEKPNAFVYLTDDLFQDLYRKGMENEDNNEYAKEGLDLLKRMYERNLYRVLDRQILNWNDFHEREGDSGIYDMIKKGLEKENIPVYVTKIEVDVEEYQNLKNKVYVYDKNGRVEQNDWSSVPLFYSFQHYVAKHLEVIFYSKSNNTAKEKLAIKSVIERVQRNCSQTEDSVGRKRLRQR